MAAQVATAGMADRTEFEKIAMPHLNSVFRAALALCGRADEAEDLTQTSVLKAFERFGSFRAGTSCRAWMLRILRNTWIDSLRHRKVVGTVLPMDEGMVAAPAEADKTTWSDAADVLENFSDEQVIKALAQLPDEQRLALFLVDVEDMTHDEVAEIMAVAVGTVKSRTSRARAALRESLRAHAEDLGLAGRMKS